MMCRAALASLLATLVLVGCAAPAPAPAAPAARAPASSAAPADPLQALIAGARQEGRLDLVWTPSVGGRTGAMQRWTDGFNRLYGLDTRIQYTAGPSMPEMGVKITQEHQAGRPATSDVFIGTENHFVKMAQAGALEPVDWAGWAPSLRNPVLLDLEGRAVEFATRVPGVTYNTDRVKGSDVPTSLQDLLQPRYKGRIASTPYGANFDALASPELWGEQRTVEYVTRFADQVAGLMRCGEIERVGSGEFDVFAMDCGTFLTRRFHLDGAPVAYTIPTDAVILSYWYVGVPSNAAHPNAAKLWIAYLLSREGQDVLYETEGLDHHLVEGSRSAPEIRELQARGSKPLEYDVPFYQRNSPEATGRALPEFDAILQKR
jgi:iron(III) transport system substrate-binding protein